MTPFRLAVLSLVRRKISTVIAVVSIAISVACSGMLFRLYLVSGSRFSTLAQGFDVVVGAKAGGIEILLNSLNGEGSYPDFLPVRLYESLKAQQKVHFEDGVNQQPTYIKAIVPFVYFAKFKSYRVVGTDSDFLNRVSPEDSIRVASGRWSSGPAEIVIGSSVAQSEGLAVDQVVPLSLWTGDENSSSQKMDFKVVGVLEEKNNIWDKMLFSNVEQAQAVLKSANLGERSIWPDGVLNYFLINLQPAGLAPLQSLVNKRTVGQVVSVPEAKQKLEDLTGTGRMLGFWISVFIMVLGGLAVASMLVARFDGMTVQLAVLRAIGFSKSEIARWLIWEGFLLGFSACVAGGLIDWVGFPILRSLLGTALPASTLVASPIYQSAPVWAAAIIATTLAVFIPLIRIYRQDIHLSLKGL